MKRLFPILLLLSASYISVLGQSLTGTGTTNYLPKFTGASAIGSSMIYEDGTNVGIGNTSPQYKLDVNGTARFTGLITNLTPGSVPFTGTSGLLTQDNSNLFWDNVNKRLGIGTAAPTNKLSIVAPGTDNTGISLGAVGNPTYATSIMNRAFATEPFYISNAFSGKVFGIKRDLVTSNQMDTYLSTYWNIAFTTGSQNPLIPNIKMYIQQNGKIGIGTTAPVEKLDVNGNIYSSGKILIGTKTLPANTYSPYSMVVNGSAIFTKALVKLPATWADYVFDKEYQLPSLVEINKFIQKYRHLPDMPSSSEVEKNGIEITDNQILLLKKVEELTLYTIELNKIVEALEKENDMLAKKEVSKK